MKLHLSDNLRPYLRLNGCVQDYNHQQALQRWLTTVYLHQENKPTRISHILRQDSKPWRVWRYTSSQNFPLSSLTTWWVPSITRQPFISCKVLEMEENEGNSGFNLRSFFIQSKNCFTIIWCHFIRVSYFWDISDTDSELWKQWKHSMYHSKIKPTRKSLTRPEFKGSQETNIQLCFILTLRIKTSLNSLSVLILHCFCNLWLAEPGMMEHAFNPNTKEVEVRESLWDQDQHGQNLWLLSNTL